MKHLLPLAGILLGAIAASAQPLKTLDAVGEVRNVSTHPVPMWKVPPSEVIEQETIANLDEQSQRVPEPQSLALLATGLAGIAALSWRNRSSGDQKALISGLSSEF